MELVGDSSWLSTSLKVFYIDLLLGADNALLIALVCRSLPPKERAEALFAGTAGAIVLRTALSAAVSILLWIPYLRVASGLVLLAVALTITTRTSTVPGIETGEPGAEPSSVGEIGPGRSFTSTVGLVVLADAVMSLDNVIAIGAVSGGRTAVVVAGLILSVPVVMFGGWLLSQLIERAKIVVVLGGVIVGLVSGELTMSDPAITSWAVTQAPALFFVVPGLAALFVLLDGQVARERTPGQTE